MRQWKLRIVVAAIGIVAGCAPIQSGPPVTPNFAFTPPNSGATTHSSMTIGILRPSAPGRVAGASFFGADVPIFDTGKAVIEQMLNATQADIERIIIARGFTTAGAYPTIDEMTYGQKQQASLILRPLFTVNLTVATVPFSGSTATISGYAVLELLEPMSREKVWVKRLDLVPITKPVRMEIGQSGGQMISVISTSSLTDLLNAFYTPTMEKMWNQLDAREIQALKRDADKLKATTQYKGG